MNLSPAELRELIRQALPTAFDADTEEPAAARLFTPGTHGLALDPDVTLVRGGRGVGKTWWFLSLQDVVLRQLAAKEYRLPRLAEQLQVRAGYGTRLDPDRYPGPSTISSLRATHHAERIWQAVCIHALDNDSSRESPNWHSRVESLRTDPSQFERVLARVDRQSGPDSYLILFDALDRLSVGASETADLVSGLLKVALELRTRTRRVRAKVFARPDLVERRLEFTDASKITANAVDLRWTDTNLYGLFFTRLGNGPQLAPNFRNETGDTWREVAADIWRANALAGDRDAQNDLFVQIAGPYMGTNHRRGRTYPWLPDHLADGRREASPRSFLSALRAAVEHTSNERAGHPYALHFDSIKTGVQRASQIRVDEISEDIPWVAEAVKSLAGMTVPAGRDEIIDRWKTHLRIPEVDPNAVPDADVRVGPRHRDNLPELISDLQQLGVMTVRADGRIDVPDVYRVAFGIARKGGVPRPTR